MSGPTTQEAMKATLESLPLAAEEIKVYGQQVMITARGEATADKWRAVLAKFCSTVRGPTRSLTYNQIDTGRRLAPDSHTVWLVWGTV